MTKFTGREGAADYDDLAAVRPDRVFTLNGVTKVITDEYADYVSAKLELDLAYDKLSWAQEYADKARAANDAAFERWQAAGGLKEN
jgi:hypothetical protein